MKRKERTCKDSLHDSEDLFAAKDKSAEYKSDDDSSDSEESVYSGLEEEESDNNDSDQDILKALEELIDEKSDASSGAEDAQKRNATEKQKSSSLSNPKDRLRKEKKLTKRRTKTTSSSTKTEAGGESVGETPAKPIYDEYAIDSSDEEDLRNTVGNVPMEWYREFEHIGYDLDGKKIGKPIGGDELDEFLDKMENPNYWRTVHDKTTGQKVVLSDQDVDVITRLRQGKYVDAKYDPYQPWVDFFTNTVMQHPLTNTPATKESFLPSKYERQKVGKMVHAMKMGWIKPWVDRTPDDATDKVDNRKYYLLWGQDDQIEQTKRQRDYISAPKMRLPGHEESYNPPPEYLFTEEEKLTWKSKEPYERRVKVIPQKYSSLRAVPAFKDFIHDRFQRCLDLYLCPRKQRIKMNLDPEDLIPQLPKPRDLMPFPSVQSLKYQGHKSFVRTISVCPTGQWLASGCDDGCVKLWEVQTGRCLKTLQMGAVVRNLAWNPNPALSLVAIATDKNVTIINSGLGDRLVQSSTDDMLRSAESAQQESAAALEGGDKQLPVTWTTAVDAQQDEGYRLTLTHHKDVAQVTWHGRGDYFAVTLKDAGSMSVFIHQLSKRRSQTPFRKAKGLVQRVLFHPVRPFFFVATQRYVRVYNLLKQQMMKKLLTNVKWVSSLAVHPGGDHVIVGSYDCKLSWFDLDLSAKPYKTLRHHRKAIREVCYHKRYPLFASASDDGTIIVCHAQVYNDLLKNPLIVPVKILRGHQIVNDLGVLSCTFHPTQPWIFTSGADNTIRLFT